MFYFFTGKQDVPVLTLAEQFIAAMPDYIKVTKSYIIFVIFLILILNTFKFLILSNNYF